MLLFLITLSLGKTVIFLNKEGYGAKVRLDGSDYSWYWINKYSASECNAYETIINISECSWLGNGISGCGSYVVDWRVDGVTSIRTIGKDSDSNISKCILDIVKNNICSYYIFYDPVTMIIIIILILLFIGLLIYIFRTKCCKRIIII